jgi:hypothetical protein
MSKLYARETRAREERRELSRRSLIKWTLAGAAALGVPRWKVFEILEKSSGKALAGTAACQPTNRSVHIIAGNGGLAWFHLLWPHNDVAAKAPTGAALYAPGRYTLANGTTNPFTLAPDAPFKAIDGKLQMSAFLAGSNETHTETPSSSSVIATGTSVFATAAAMQLVNPVLVPVIAVDNAPYGTASGAPSIARVPTPNDIVGLFNSVASRAGGMLAQQTDSDLYVAALKAGLSLNAAAQTPPTNRSYTTVRSAAKVLGTNMSSQLAVTTTDLTNYGITGTTPTKLQDLAKTLIIAAKAFATGLTSSVILPAFRDDPHGAFGDLPTTTNTVQSLGKIMDAFYADLMARDDATCAGHKVGESVVISIHGDTPKDPLNQSGWPDGTENNANWTYVFGNGWLKTGWFGGISAGGAVTGWNPGTGGTSTLTSSQLAMPASAAIAYAVAKGDIRRVDDFYKGVAIDGVVTTKNM